jgi:hypothetical protein
MGIAHEEAVSGLGLKSLDVLADGWLSQSEPAACLGEALGLHHGYETEEKDRVKHLPITSYDDSHYRHPASQCRLLCQTRRLLQGISMIVRIGASSPHPNPG